MEPGGSLPHSQEPATCPYPDPAQLCYSYLLHITGYTLTHVTQDTKKFIQLKKGTLVFKYYFPSNLNKLETYHGSGTHLHTCTRVTTDVPSNATGLPVTVHVNAIAPCRSTQHTNRCTWQHHTRSCPRMAMPIRPAPLTEGSEYNISEPLLSKGLALQC
jgi:hypothetical protein